VFAVLVVAGCSLEVPPASYISKTELIMVRHSAELGPLYPERAGPTFTGMEAAPIAEVLPGDRVRLEAVVVDTDGIALPRAELETLWLQCGGSCDWHGLTFANSLYDVPCTELDPYTTDDYCMLGTGDGRFEFEVPELGPNWVFGVGDDMGAHTAVYGVVAWDGQSVEDCWAARRTDQRELDDCDFIYHNIALGPHYTAIIHAFSIGLGELDAEPPSWLVAQPANRIPLPPAVSVSLDGIIAATGVPPLPPIQVEPGARIDIALTFDLFSQSLQRTLSSVDPATYDDWKLEDEILYSRTATSGAIRQTGANVPMVMPVVGDGSFGYEVDPSATTGSSRVLIIYGDHQKAADFLTLEFEVR
jgi:hypothetical protein